MRPVGAVADQLAQQRLALELTWEALEHAHIPASDLKGGPVGVFLGTSTNDYQMLATMGLNLQRYSHRAYRALAHRFVEDRVCVPPEPPASATDEGTPALDRRCGDRRRLADAGIDRCHDPVGPHRALTSPWTTGSLQDRQATRGSKLLRHRLCRMDGSGWTWSGTQARSHAQTDVSIGHSASNCCT